jgi:lysophospholipase L1-like esterase
MLKKSALLIFLWCVIILTSIAQPHLQIFNADNSAFSYFGRTDRSDPNVVRFDWPGVYMRCAFTGNQLEIRLKGGKRDYFNVFVDDLPVKIIHPDLDSIVAFEQLSGKGVHELLITKRTEADMGMASFYGIGISSLGKISKSKVSNKRKIEFIGNSITCGYGAEGLSVKERFKPETENSYFSYASIAARAFSADYSLIAHSGLGVIRNYNDKSKISTSIAAMPSRLSRTFDSDSVKKWNFNQFVPDAVVINLGTNDYSTLPHPDKAVFKRHYEQLIENILKVYGIIPVFCVVGPMTNEPCYSIVKEVVEDYNLIHLGTKVYFVGIPDGLLNNTTDLGSDGHPSYRGQRKSAAYLVPLMANVMKWNYLDREIRFGEEY